jgi:hypothetical protein
MIMILDLFKVLLAANQNNKVKIKKKSAIFFMNYLFIDKKLLILPLNSQ